MKRKKETFANRCLKCDKPLRSFNKSEICSNCANNMSDKYSFMAKFYKKHQNKLEITKAYIGLLFITGVMILDMYFNHQFYTEFMVTAWSFALIIILAGVFNR